MKVRPALVKHSNAIRRSRKRSRRSFVGFQTRYSQWGDLGPAVVPGDLKKSLLVEAIHWKNEDLQMPPKKKLPQGPLLGLTHGRANCGQG